MANFYAQYPAVSGGGSNASVGTNGTTAPTSSTEVAGVNPSGNLQPLQTDAAGNLLVDIASPINVSENVAQFGGNDVVTGTGASGLGIPRFTVSNDSTIGLNAGSNNIGSITDITGTQTLPTGASTAALQSNVQSAPGTSASVALTIQGSASGVSLPVTVSSLPLPTGAATSANQTNGSQETQIVQGGNTATVTASSALKVDGSAVTQPVSGTVTVTQTNPTNLNATVTQSVAGNLNAAVIGTGTAGSPSLGVLSVQGISSGTALSVSAASLPLPTGAATSALQSNVQSATGTSATTAITIQGSASGVAIPVSGSVTATNPSVGTTSTAVPASATYVGMNVAGSLTGLTGTTNGLKVDGSAVTQPISASALPLPTGASTSALQSSVQGSVAAGTAALNSQLAGLVYNTVTPTLTNGQQAALQSDSSGNLKVNVISGGGSNASVSTTGTTVPASATYVGMTVAGTLTGLTGTANGLKVDGSAVTQPISAAALPLPTGAATSALQSNVQSAVGTSATTAITVQGSSTGAALPVSGTVTVTQSTASNLNASVIGTGTAGSPSLGVLSVQGIASGTALNVSATSLPLPVGAATSALQSSVQGSAAGGTAAASSQLDGGIYNSTAPTLTNTQQAALQLDSSANLKVNVVTGSITASNPSVGTTGVAAPTSATEMGIIGPTGNLVGLTVGQTTSTSAIPVVIANDQSGIPVTTAPGVILATPTANSMAALNAAVQYQVNTIGNFYLTVTNGPGATTAWSGTVSFQYSTNGTAWNTLTVQPIASPANSANVTSTTANGLYSVQAPSSGAGVEFVYIRASMTSYASGTAYFFIEGASSGAAKVIIPWTYTVTSGQTVVGPLEASGMTSLDVQISAITTTVLTAQGTNDPTLTTWTAVPAINAGAVAATVGTLSAALTYRVNPQGYKWIRLQCTTTGTVLTIQGITAIFGQQPLLLTSFGNDIGVTINAGTLPTVTTVGTVTTVSTVSAVTSSNTGIPGIIADVASAAITATATTAAFTPTYGSSYMIDIPVTAVSGTTPTLQVTVQESPDSGTNWYNVYAFPTITTTGSYISPVITMTGNRVRYVQTLTGTTPSFTRAINRLQSSQAGYSVPSGTNYVDRSGTTSGTPSTSTQVAAFNNQRRYFIIQNLSSSAPIYINFTSAANAGSGSLYLAPFGSYVMESGTITNEAINVLATVASVAYSAKEG